MKLLPVLTSVFLIVGLSTPAHAAKKRSHHSHSAQEAASEDSGSENASEETPAAGKAEARKAPDKAGSSKTSLDFDFFAGQTAAAGGVGASSGNLVNAPELEEEAKTRRWMLIVHQTLGITTWAAMLATVVIGQLNYNELWGGGSGSPKWQTPHRALVITTSALFATTGAFSLLAPTPYKRPLRFDTGLVHRIAVIGATAGMVAEGFLGWITTHQADAGNPHNAKTLAQTHQIIGYTTFGFLTVAGAVWLF